jgi:hypothetical protein
MTVDELVDWIHQHEDQGFWATRVQKSDPGMWMFGRNGYEGPYYAILRDEDPDRILRIHDHLVAQFGLPARHVAGVETPPLTGSAEFTERVEGFSAELIERVERIVRRMRERHE